jgi:putative membrane protein
MIGRSLNTGFHWSSTMAHYLTNLPAFLLWWGIGAGLLAIFGALYVAITPLNELKLIRAGNVSVSIIFSGALLGYVLPVASAIIHGVDIIDLALWGFIAMLVQCVVYLALRLLVPRLNEELIADNRAVALMGATICVVAGILNAAAMSY